MKKKRHIILKVVLALFGLGAFWLAFEHFRGKVSLAAYKRKLIQAGEKLTVNELIPTIRAEDNCAPDVVRLGKQLQEGRIMHAHIPYAMKIVAPGRAAVAHVAMEWTDKDWNTNTKQTNNWTQVAEELEQNRETLEQLRFVLNKPVLHGDVDYSDLEHLDMAYLMQTKSVSLWFSGAILAALHIGHLNAAFEYAIAQIRLTRIRDRFVMHQLVRIAIASIAVNTTWEMLQANGWSGGQLERLQKAWQEPDFLGDMEKALEMERVVGETYFDRFRESNTLTAACVEAIQSAGGWQAITGASDGVDSSDKHPKLEKTVQQLPYGNVIWDIWTEKVLPKGRKCFYVPIWRFAWSHQDELRSLEISQELIEVTRGAITNQAAKFLSPQFDRLREKVQPHGVYEGIRFLISSQNSGVLPSTVKKAIQAETQRSLVLCAIALKRYQLRYGTSPRSLSDLIPKFLDSLPVDFKDGKPIRYRKEPDGAWIIYSVGEDGKDDGGDANPPTKAVKPRFLNGKDLVWPKPAAAAVIKESEEKHP